jgi:hypothetical protein
MEAMVKADFKTARALFAKEVKRAPYNHEFHFWLALAHWRLGDGPRAHEELKLALDTSTTGDASRRYSAKLSQLKNGATAVKRVY